MNKEIIAIKIARLIEQKSKFQDIVGELVLSVKEAYGKHQTDELQELIKEQGVTVSASSLRQYAWVVKSSKELDLPEDLDFSTRRQIINSPLRDKYLKLIKAGSTSAQIKREMAIDNKQSKTKHTGYCKDCGKEVDVKKHNCKEVQTN